MSNTIPDRQVICQVLLDRAKKDKAITVLCSDSRGSASLAPFAKEFPEQFVEMGIAEQSLVSTAAGMARCGLRPFAASPASFLSTRSMEQVKVDVAYSHTNVKLIGISVGAVGISNQRETALLWDRDTGLPVADAVVWQCARAAGICQRLADRGEAIQERTGLNLSPYFPAAKWAWLLENTPGLAGKDLCAGTIDAWLVYKLTGGRVFARTTPTPPAPSCSTCGPFPGMRRSAAGSASAPPCFRRCALATASLGRRTLGAFCPTLCLSTGCWGTPTAH